MTVRGPAEAFRASTDEEVDAIPETATVATAPMVLPVMPMSGPGTGVCRYLRAADGSHRTMAASREHRCWAVEPPSTLPTGTQQELCLGAGHTACERYQALRDRRAIALAADQIPVQLLETPRFAPPVSTIPIAVDARPSGRDANAGEDRQRRLPTMLIGIGVILVAVVAIVALFGGGAFLGGEPTPTAPAIAGGATDGPDRTQRPTPPPTPVRTVAPTGPTPTTSVPATSVPATQAPVPSFTLRRRYTVKDGETWRTIARRFDLRPRDLRAVNPIRGQLEAGMVILIPDAPVVTDD